MTSTHTTTKKTNHYFRALTALVALAMLAMLLTATASRTAHASTTFTVNFTGDFADIKVGDGICDATASSEDTCTLRAAIQEANAISTEADTIDFDIPEAFRDPSSGVATISPNSALPPITDQVTIDGYTQPGASPNTKAVGEDAVLKIELAGPGANGLVIDNSDGSVIRGLVINGSGAHIVVRGDSVGNRIEGNFIGTDPTGTIGRVNRGEAVSIFEGPSQTVVGGTTPASRNVISGNFGGIFVANSSGNRIEGNYVGTDKSGTKDLGNLDGGIVIRDASGTTVGGKTTASRNVISGNDKDGLVIDGSQGTKVLGNRIGTTASSAGALGNGAQGVFIFGTSSDNLIGDGTSAGSNTIAFNAQDGVDITESTATGNEISRNSIFSNAGLGIDLLGPGEDTTSNVSTPNDAGDADTGPNNLQNKPALSSARTTSGKTTIKGTLSSRPGATYTIQFFSNPSGTNEGKTFIGQKTGLQVDGLGKGSFTFSPATQVALGKAITATAINEFTGDTSEFSAPKKVVAS